MKKYLALIFLAFGVFGVFALSSAAPTERVKFSENNAISDSVCKIYYTFTGTIAKAMAVFVIIVTAFGFLLGKVSWGIVISIAIAIGMLFSGEAMLRIFVGPKAKSGCQCKAGTMGFGQNCQARSDVSVPKE